MRTQQELYQEAHRLLKTIHEMQGRNRKEAQVLHDMEKKCSRVCSELDAHVLHGVEVEVVRRGVDSSEAAS